MKKTQATPDGVCAVAARKKVKMTVRALDADADIILIEGEKAALEFLGKLLLAQANSPDCGFHLTPSGAGKTLFSRKATKGIYIHRLPCEHVQSKKPREKAPAANQPS